MSQVNFNQELKTVSEPKADKAIFTRLAVSNDKWVRQIASTKSINLSDVIETCVRIARQLEESEKEPA